MIGKEKEERGEEKWRRLKRGEQKRREWQRGEGKGRGESRRGKSKEK